MLRTIRIAIFLSLIASACGCELLTGSCDLSTDSKISEAELAIFSILVKDLPPNLSTIGGSPHRVIGLTSENIKKLVPEIRDDTFADFTRRNSGQIDLEKEYLLRPGYPLVSRQSIDPYRNYSFSRVGFSRDGKQAFVYFHDACSPLCARSAFYLLVESEGSWHIIRELEGART